MAAKIYNVDFIDAIRDINKLPEQKSCRGWANYRQVHRVKVVQTQNQCLHKFELFFTKMWASVDMPGLSAITAGWSYICDLEQLRTSFLFNWNISMNGA